MCCAHSVCAMVWLYAPTRTSLLRTCSLAENFCCRQTSLTMSPGVALNPNLDPSMTLGSEPLNPPLTQGLQPKGCLFPISLSREAPCPLAHAWSLILFSLWVSVLPLSLPSFLCFLFLFACFCPSLFQFLLPGYLSSFLFISSKEYFMYVCMCVCVSVYYLPA